MAIFIPKLKYLKKNKDYVSKLSRIPLGTLSLEPYKIRPYTSALVAGLEKRIVELMETPESIDGQNGNVLDNYIINWENRAKAELNKQRAFRANSIMVNSGIRAANLKNAYDWLNIDKKKLEQINNNLVLNEKEYDYQNENYINW